MSYIYFTRHGQTIWNVENKICGATDIVLTKKGHEQAIMLGESIAKQNLSISEILYSPLVRAKETALHISRITGIPAREDKRLKEQNFGKYESTARDGAEFGLAKQQFLCDYEGGESMVKLCHRVYGLLDELRMSDKVYLLVAHNGIARVVESYFREMTNEEFAQFGIKNCEIRRYEFPDIKPDIQSDIQEETMEEIVWVDEDDQVIGYGEKLETHKKKQLHRAFSVFVYHDGYVLLQRRAKDKYHSGGLLSNSCCSHQRKNENMEQAISRCIKEELGVHSFAKPVEVGVFQYLADFGKLAEHEIDHVYMTDCNNFIPNPLEVEEVMWVSVSQIRWMLAETPECFTPWFEKAFHFLEKYISEQ